MAKRSRRKRQFSPGEKIGLRYQILETIGSGAVGVVVRACDQELDREVIALKILHPHLVDDEQAFMRFQNEVLVCRQLSHPNIVRVYDFDEASEEELYFLSMECIQGPNLRQYLDIHKGRKLAFEDCVRIVNQLAQALAFAHDKGIVHRDIKPSNILLNTDGNAKLTDFGLARSLESSMGLTQTGEALGTPFYMSPEQFTGQSSDPRSDIYSLGVVAYEMVCGSVPFSNDNYYLLAKQHLQEAFPKEALEGVHPPTWFIELIETCTAKEKNERFQNCDEVLQHIRKHGSEWLLSPRIELKRNKIRSFFAVERFPKELRYLTRFLLFSLLIACLPLVLQDGNFRIRLLSKIYQIEKSFTTDLNGLKRMFRFHPTSALEPQALFKAVEHGYNHEVEALLRSGESLSQRNPEGDTVYHVISRSGESSTVGSLKGAEGAPDAVGVIDFLDRNGKTAFHLAIENDRHDVAMALVQYNANINISDGEGNTLFHTASKKHSSDLIRTLLRKVGLDRSILWRKNKKGNTSLHIAVREGDLKTIKTLVEPEIGMYPDVIDHKGRTPLMIAVNSKLPQGIDIFDSLIDAGANVRARDYEGGSVLMSALHSSSPYRDEMIVRLISLGANTRFRDDQGRGIWDYCRTPADKELIEKLLMKRRQE